MTGTGAGSFGSVLRRLREAAGVSQEELAGRAGLSSHAVSALERGTRTRPYPHTVRALADALGLGEEDRGALVGSVPSRGRSAGQAVATDTSAVPVGRHRGLPVPPTRLIGRDDDLREVVRLLDLHRLVTLTGPGGVGKTRLSLAVARTLEDRYADGVVFVELAALRDPDQVMAAVLDAADVTATPGEDPVAAMSAWAATRELLLVLDNVEHLLAAAPQVAALIGAVPHLSVLASSRAPLRVRAEQEYAVEPLALPDPDAPAAPGEEAPAVRMLLERAGAVSAGWGTGAGDAGPVATIAVRLAGIPLALELAGARGRLLDPASLLDRLDDALLVGGRDRPERHRTMRATLDWSHGLLTPEEQALLRLLSVFVGGFRLGDLEGVVARAGGVGGEVLEVLESLAEQSLVVSDPDAAGGVRHRLLEPVAQYAAARLEESGQRRVAVLAHAAHFLALAEEVAPRYRDSGQVAALARADADHPNLTAAVESFLDADEVGSAGRLCWSLWMYWWLRGHHALGRRLSEATLGRDLPGDVRPLAELAAATMSFAMDDVPAARSHWDAALAHAGTDDEARGNAIAGIGLAELASGRLAEATERFAEARGPSTAAGPAGEWTVALSWIWSGTVAMLLGDADRALVEIERGLESARRRGDRLSTYIALYNLSQVELVRGRPDRARAYLDEGTLLSLETRDHANLAYLLDAAAVVEARQGTHSRVPLLLGAAQGIRDALGSFGYGYYRPDPAAIDDAAGQARRHLGPDRYDDALDVGRGLEPDRAARLALGDSAAGA